MKLTLSVDGRGMLAQGVWMQIDSESGARSKILFRGESQFKEGENVSEILIHKDEHLVGWAYDCSVWHTGGLFTVVCDELMFASGEK